MIICLLILYKLVLQHGWTWFSLVKSIYVDHLQFIENKLHKYLLKTPMKNLTNFL